MVYYEPVTEPNFVGPHYPKRVASPEPRGPTVLTPIQVMNRRIDAAKAVRRRLNFKLLRSPGNHLIEARVELYTILIGELKRQRNGLPHPREGPSPKKRKKVVETMACPDCPASLFKLSSSSWLRSYEKHRDARHEGAWATPVPPSVKPAKLTPFTPERGGFWS